MAKMVFVEHDKLGEIFIAWEPFENSLVLRINLENKWIKS